MSTVDLTGARWRKSSYSGGTGGGNDNCVEVALIDWRKSSHSSGTGGGNSDCVEVAFAGPVAAIRDSKNAAGPVLALPADSWTTFLNDRAIVIYATH
jgi:hypothetical protein